LSEEARGSTSAAARDAISPCSSARLRVGVGVDYEQAYIVEAHWRAGGRPMHFVNGDATRLLLGGGFDLATCLTNSWGTMSDKQAATSSSSDSPTIHRPAPVRVAVRQLNRTASDGCGWQGIRHPLPAASGATTPAEVEVEVLK